MVGSDRRRNDRERMIQSPPVGLTLSICRWLRPICGGGLPKGCQFTHFRALPVKHRTYVHRQKTWSDPHCRPLAKAPRIVAASTSLRFSRTWAPLDGEERAAEQRRWWVHGSDRRLCRGARRPQGHSDRVRARPRPRWRAASRGARVQDLHPRPQAAARVAHRSRGDPRRDGGDRRVLATGVACTQGSRGRRAVVGQRISRQECAGAKDRRVGCGMARPVARVRIIERQFRAAAGDRTSARPHPLS